MKDSNKLKIGKRRLELAARSWEMVDICEEDEKSNYKNCHFDKAYTGGKIERELPGKIGVYKKTNSTDISRFVINEIKRYKRRYKHDKTFLNNVYKKIIHDESGIYKKMFEDERGEICQLLYYFIDEMRYVEWENQADKLEYELRKKFFDKN